MKHPMPYHPVTHFVSTKARSVPLMFGSCASLAALVGTFDAAGKTISSSFSSDAAASHGVALEGAQDGGEAAGHGSLGWRQQRERRRETFFKVSCSGTSGYFVELYLSSRKSQMQTSRQNRTVHTTITVLDM